jgi:hypothetical protein
MRAFARLLVLLAALIVAPAAAAQERAWPRMLALDDCAAAGACTREAWLAFLRGCRAGELAAPPGGRAYRWIWINDIAPGCVELTVQPDGSGELRSNLHRKPRPVTAANVAAFEAQLARSPFGSTPEQDPLDRATILDYPPEQLMEALVDGRYHFVHRIVGMPETIWQAGKMLERLAGVR